MALQIFGTPRCQETKKAQRFFKERGKAFQFIDLSQKGMSPGELRSVAAVLGIEALADRDGRRWKEISNYSSLCEIGSNIDNHTWLA